MVSLAITRVRQGHAPFAGLVWTLIRTDFKTRYHGTMGGFVWALLKPLTMFLVLLAVFSYVFATDPQYKFDLIIGLFLYEFFQEATKAGLLSLRAKGYLLTKARFPSWIVVVTSASNAVITLALFSLVLVMFLGGTGRAPSAIGVALYTVYLVLFLAIVTGFSLAASVLFMRYRDLNQVWEVVTHAGFFVAPIIYPIGIIPERMHAYLYAWPPTPIILFSRSVLLDGHVPSLLAHLLLLIVAALVLSVGALIYRVRAPRVAEEL
ncbi:MAG TPA: ABC transporter permease [Vicinamibacterales bacterium]|jgi:homopolymeric O-antigen transport system permease protein|nr:ABC transporter permease [Vicinamibacterales bacterium]